jgi:hypothetical protein
MGLGLLCWTSYWATMLGFLLGYYWARPKLKHAGSLRAAVLRTRAALRTIVLRAVQCCVCTATTQGGNLRVMAKRREREEEENREREGKKTTRDNGRKICRNMRKKVNSSYTMLRNCFVLCFGRMSSKGKRTAERGEWLRRENEMERNICIGSIVCSLGMEGSRLSTFQKFLFLIFNFLYNNIKTGKATLFLFFFKKNRSCRIFATS